MSEVINLFGCFCLFVELKFVIVCYFVFNNKNRSNYGF